jgi:hypothetical protein
MSNIQDLEQQIFKCQEITEDLWLVASEHEDNNDISNKVLGLMHVYTMRFNKLWNLYEKSIADYYELRTELKQKNKGDS